MFGFTSDGLVDIRILSFEHQIFILILKLGFCPVISLPGASLSLFRNRLAKRNHIRWLLNFNFGCARTITVEAMIL